MRSVGTCRFIMAAFQFAQEKKKRVNLLLAAWITTKFLPPTT